MSKLPVSQNESAFDEFLGRRELSCQCCSAVDDCALDDLIEEVIRLRGTSRVADKHTEGSEDQ